MILKASVLLWEFIIDWLKMQNDFAILSSGSSKNCLTQIRDLQDAALIRDNRVHDLELLIATLEGKMETLAKEGSIKEKNARDDFERWRTRLVRTLKDATDLLNNGLVAIRRHPPHIDVIDDHVQRVFDSLTSHIKALHEDFKP